MHYPAHEPRAEDPHYVDFEHFHRKHRATARCYVGQRIGYGDCKDAQGNAAPPPTVGLQPGLELHHTHIEEALKNAVDLAAMEVDYPGISNRYEVGAWVNDPSGANFRWLCAYHHRGAAGAHSASHSDWEGEQYIKGLIT
jgi:hypothetical protein